MDSIIVFYTKPDDFICFHLLCIYSDSCVHVGIASLKVKENVAVIVFFGSNLLSLLLTSFKLSRCKTVYFCRVEMYL